MIAVSDVSGGVYDEAGGDGLDLRVLVALATTSDHGLDVLHVPIQRIVAAPLHLPDRLAVTVEPDDVRDADADYLKLTGVFGLLAGVVNQDSIGHGKLLAARE